MLSKELDLQTEITKNSERQLELDKLKIIIQFAKEHFVVRRIRFKTSTS